MSPLVHLYFFHFHVFFSILALFGVFLMFHWVKQLSVDIQKKAALWCLAIGGIGVLVSVPFCYLGWSLIHAVGM